MFTGSLFLSSRTLSMRLSQSRSLSRFSMRWTCPLICASAFW